MGPKVSKKWLPKFMSFFDFLSLFDTFLKPLKAHFLEDVQAKMAVFAFFHVFEKWLKNASKKLNKN